jgi:hypothetical protein
MDKTTLPGTRSVCACLQNPPIPFLTNSLGITITCETYDAWWQAHAANAAEPSSNYFRIYRAPDSPINFPGGLKIMWSSKSTPAAPHEQRLHETGRGYT